MPIDQDAVDRNFAAQLRRWRASRGLTQAALAERAACSAEVIRKFESGARRPSLQTADALAAALDLSGEQRLQFVAAARGIDLEPVEAAAQPAQSVPPPLIQPTWFARTKLQPPRRRSAVLLRSRLMERMRQGIAGARLALVVAPAGAGKTTLLASTLVALARPYAWVNLDEEDNDPRRLLALLAAAADQLAQNAGVEARRLLAATLNAQFDQALLARRCIDALVNELFERLAQPSLLVLDDLHVLTAPACLAAMTELIEQLPQQLTLIVAARQDPPLPLSRWRARRELAEVRLDDLRFSDDETAALLNNILGLGLSSAEISALGRRTEGWAAGLSLFAASLERITTPLERERFFARLTSTDHTLFDYLAEEVLNRQDPFVRMFLLETAVLPALTPAACRAVTGRADAVVVLEDLYRRNLFLAQLDDQFTGESGEASYRYHDLFRDFLRVRLVQEAPDHARAVHLRAASAAKDPAQAVEHLLQAGAWDRAAAAIVPLVQLLLDRGAQRRLRLWLEAMPAPVVQHEPRLALAMAIVLADSARAADALAWLAFAEQGAAQLPDSVETLDLRGQIALHAAMLAAFAGDAPQMIAQTERAVTLLRPAQQALRAQAYFLQGLIAVGGGDLASAEQRFAEAADSGAAAGRTYLASVAINNQIYMQRARGNHHAALTTCERVLRRGSAVSHFTGMIQTWQADLLRERNELDAALELADAGVDSSLFWDNADFVMLAHVTLARVYQARGEPAAARAALAAAYRHAGPIAWMKPITAAFEAQLNLIDGDAATIARAHPLAEDDLIPFRGLSPHGYVYDYEHRRIIASQAALAVARADGTIDALRAHLARLRASAGAAGVTWLQVKSLVLEALAADLSDDMPCARAALLQALRISAAEGYMRVFLDEGKPLIGLMRALCASARHAAEEPAILLARRLLDALQGGSGPSASSSAPLPALEEPLTRREQDVLQLLARGASNADIADQLVISPHTVKRHIANILGKLGVHSRTAAAIRARDLGLS